MTTSRSQKKKPKKIDRPFAAGVLRKARTKAEKFQIVLKFERGKWYGRGLEMPHVFGDGATPAACIENTRLALTGAVAYLIESGKKVPSPL